MKTFLPVLLIVLISCKTTKKSMSTISNTISVTAINCPENGNCKLELIPNSSLEFKKDTFGVVYPVLKEGNNVILKYTFKKNTPENAADSNYTELLYAELNNPISENSLTNNDLQKVKLHFGRLCYCKGETGYFPITLGLFQLKKTSKDSLEIQIDFKQKKIPQLISTIKQTISLKSTSTN